MTVPEPTNTHATFSDASLALLRASVAEGQSDYRFHHTEEVEKMAGRLASLFCPESASLLQAAALLHDFTKEFSNETQEKILRDHGILYAEADGFSPKLYHAVTAALLIPERYPAYADPVLISAVRYHTTGRKGMTLTDEILYFADYIDESRTFPECVAVRDFFWGADPGALDLPHRLALLQDALLLTLENTVRSLLMRRSPISPDSICFYNDLIAKKHTR